MHTTTTTLPTALTGRRQWLLWKGSKQPLGRDMKPASKNDETAWLTFDEACRIARENDAGLGFVICEGDSIVGIDLDHVITSEGELVEWAAAIVDRCAGAYVEFSPSRTGLHLFGVVPNKVRCSRTRITVVAPDQRLEVYTHGAFLTVTGDRWYMFDQPAGDIQGGFDWIAQSYLSTGTGGYVRPVEDCPAWVQEVDLQKRIAAANQIIDEAEPAISGQGGHNTTFVVAAKIIRGLGIIDPGAAMLLMERYNREKCQPPWSPRELEHKVRQAMHNCRDIEWGGSLVYHGLSPFAEFGANIAAGLRGESEGDAKPEPDDDRPPFDDSLFEVDGLLGDIMAYAASQAHAYQPEVSLAGAIGLLAAVSGRAYQWRGGRCMLHSYLAVLAPSASGKNSTLAPIERIAVRADAGHLFQLQTGSGGTRQGLMVRLMGTPCFTWVMDECHALFLDNRNVKDPRFGLINDIKTLFSAEERFSGDVYADASKNRSVDQPAMSLLGMTVPDEFWRALTLDSVSDGLIGRMVVLGVRDPYRPRYKQDYADPPKHVVNAIHQMAERLKEPGKPRPLMVKDAAARRLEEYAAKVLQKHRTEEELARCIWGRAAEKAQRLSFLRAVSEDPDEPIVSRDHVEWAIALVNASHGYVISRVSMIGMTSDQQERTRIVSVLRARKTMTKSQLLRQFQQVTAKEMQGHIQRLIDEGLVATTYTQNGGPGRPVTEFRWLGTGALPSR